MANQDKQPMDCSICNESFRDGGKVLAIFAGVYHAGKGHLKPIAYFCKRKCFKKAMQHMRKQEDIL